MGGDGLASPSPENAKQFLWKSAVTNICVSSIKKAGQKELELPYKSTCPGGAWTGTPEAAPSPGLPTLAASTEVTVGTS